MAGSPDVGPASPAGAGGRTRLGIVAGSGTLPARVVASCLRAGRDIFVVALQGEADRAVVRGLPHIWSRIGAGGSIIQTLHDEGVTELVFAGGVKRPSIASLRPDLRTARFFARVGRRAFGDDGLLRAMIEELEAEGFRVVQVQSLLDDILVQPGLLSRIEPDAGARADIRRGFEVIHELGRLDIGQAVIVQAGFVLGVEAAEGTDALIERCRTLHRPGDGGILVKAAKPQQERRVDLPTIGRRTVRRAREGGLRGIAVEAGGALIIDRDAVAAEADRAGLFLIGVDPSRLAGAETDGPP